MTADTSVDSPLRIAEIPVGSEGGMIGITFAPGKWQNGAITGMHRRNLDADLDCIAAWKAVAVVTLVEAHELESMRIGNLGEGVQRRGMTWHHWPIADYSVPDPAFDAAWSDRSNDVRGILVQGGRVLIHCKGGLGRAGMISARVLVESGMTPAKAIRTVRSVRPGAVETPEQEEWVALGRPMSMPRRI